jgi:histidine triad (HIT) family protein
MQPLVTLFFNHMDQFLPVDRLVENENWMAFHHPQPDYPLHILILPKQSIPSLATAPLESPEVYGDLIEAVQTLVRQFLLEERGYRLITNGGPNQSIPQWHWHLISEQPGEPHD